MKSACRTGNPDSSQTLPINFFYISQLFFTLVLLTFSIGSTIENLFPPSFPESPGSSDDEQKVLKNSSILFYEMVEQSEVWDRIFSTAKIDYDELLRDDLSPIMRKLKNYDVEKILDLGCGYGHWSMILAKTGFDVVSVDISGEAIEHLRGEIEERDIELRTEVLDAENIDSLDERFSCVISNSVLDHMNLNDAIKVLGKIEDILIESGIAYLTFDGKEEESNYETLEDGTRSYLDGIKEGTLWRFYTDEEIKDICSRFELLEFDVSKNGKREVWLRK